MNYCHQAILLMLLLLSLQMMGQDINISEETTTVEDSTQTGYRCYQPGCVVPSFPGGTEGLMTWLSENITYPAEAERDSIQGKVVVSFMIKPDGTPCNPEIISSPHPLLSQEALRVIGIMPKWNPGSGVDLEKFQLPLTFSLDSQKPIDSCQIDRQSSPRLVLDHPVNLGETFHGWKEGYGYILPPRDQFIKYIPVSYNGIDYDLGLSNNHIIRLIETSDKRFSVNGYKVGDEITRTSIIRGWGIIAKIDDEWYAAWTPKDMNHPEEEETGKIQWFFKFDFNAPLYEKEDEKSNLQPLYENLQPLFEKE